MVDEQAGKAAYEAYREFAKNKSLATGDPLPTWENLSDIIRGGWIAAASAAVIHDRRVRGAM